MFGSVKVAFSLVVLTVVVMVVAIIWQPAKKLVLQDACIDNGGKWASNGNYCIHRQCAEDNSCKPSYRNNVICETLEVGIEQSELYFQLGMPESNLGNVYTFTGGGEGSQIKVTIINGLAGELKCGT